MSAHRSAPWPRLLRGVAAGLWLGCAPVAPAGAAIQASCAEPVIFSGSDVNLVLLPYELNSPELRLRQDSFALWESEGARALASMIQFDTLYSLNYPASLAVVQLYAEGGECSLSLDEIKQRITAMLMPSKAAVFLWGGLVERDGEIFIQSYVEFLRKDRPALMAFDMPSPDGSARYVGGVPQSGIGLPPHVLSEADLEAIRNAAATSRGLSAEPGGPPTLYLPDKPTETFAFFVTGTDDKGWMRIRAAASEYDSIEPESMDSVEGWLPAQPAWDLRVRLPELSFVDGVIGFVTAQLLEERAEAEGWDERARARYDQARRRSTEALERFIATTRPGEGAADIDAATAIALARAMQGGLALNGSPVEAAGAAGAHGQSRERIDAAIRNLEDATAQIPYHPETRNLLAIALAARAAMTAEADDARRAVAEWQTALSMAPDDAAIPANLTAFYRSWGNARVSGLLGLSEMEIAEQLTYLDPQD